MLSVIESEAFKRQERNRAFVRMQYFGHLRRNPNDPPEPGLNFAGFNFRLNKPNQFNGDSERAEMVRAFPTPASTGRGSASLNQSTARGVAS